MDVEELLLLKCLNLNKIIREYISLGLDLNLDIISEKYNIDKNKVLKSKEKVKEIVDNCKENRIDILGYFDNDYPLEFRNLKDFPLVIYKKGSLSNKPKLAVVGTRQPTKKAVDFAKEISICAIENDYTIISGLAVGIDTIAHNMSIEKKFETTAILPSNLTNIYPKININLSEKILDNNGCLLTEYNFLDEIKKYHFINRDRLQAAYSLAVIVIESTKNGG
ncbi:MAG: DNA-processing protein DprA, partial [Clostridiales bacterium]